MLAGAAIATVGFGASALAYNLYDFLLVASLCALGYADGLRIAQGYVLDRTDASTAPRASRSSSARSWSPPCADPRSGNPRGQHRLPPLLRRLGGDGARVDLRDLAPSRARSAAARPAHLARARHCAEIVALRRAGAFMALTGLAAMPAKIILTGMCFY
jgi:hypothetical protein